MFEIIKGDYNIAKVFTNIIEPEAYSQIQGLLNQPISKGEKIRIMPDVHAGVGCTIGTTMTITDKVIPSMVGVDIGCGMKVAKLTDKDVDLKKLDDFIHTNIPSGRNVREDFDSFYAILSSLQSLHCFENIDEERAYQSIGTLGGGNHFIEVDKDKEGNLYLVIHTGSRYLGKQVATYYQNKAYKNLTTIHHKEIKTMVENLKTQGREKEIQLTLDNLYKTKKSNISKELSYVQGELFNDYIYDMGIVQRYAELNRDAILCTIITGMKLNAIDVFDTVHNYIDTTNLVLRKGAVSAQKNEKLIIPMNMKDGSLICKGKGNIDWNCSAPHGAGRIMSRNQARKELSLDEFKQQMNGIYSTSVSKNTIDESPMVYKPMKDIVDNIGDTVEIIDVIKPIYNFKADT